MKWLKGGILFVAVLSAVLAAPTPFADEDSFRLPQTSRPIHYDIELKTDVHSGQSAFQGKVKIDIEIVEDTNVITLHNRGLKNLDVKLFDAASAPVALATLREDVDKDFLHIETETKNLLAGESYTIEITYDGILQVGTSGFYRSSYKVDGETR